MSTANTYITDDKKVIINCPHCLKSTTVPLEKFGQRHRNKVKCTCGNIFVAEIDYRDKFRKKVDLPAHYHITEESRRKRGAKVNWESVAINKELPNCRITDISRSGIGFTQLDKQELMVEDVIHLTFTLDNSTATQINQLCEVRHLKENHVGCLMLSVNTSLGFYLLS